MEAAVEEYLSVQPQEPGVVFDWLYEELPTAYARQRAEMLKED